MECCFLARSFWLRKWIGMNTEKRELAMKVSTAGWAPEASMSCTTKLATTHITATATMNDKPRSLCLFNPNLTIKLCQKPCWAPKEETSILFSLLKAL